MTQSPRLLFVEEQLLSGYAGEIDKIMPIFIAKAMPKWFGLLFLLTLLAAAMSTLSGQFHVLGASLGRDVYEQITGHQGGTIGVSRIAIIIGIIIAVLLGHYARGGYVIARATAIFFGICASTFLPAFIGGLFTRSVTRTGAKVSMLVGLGVTIFWLVFIKSKEAGAIGIVQKITEGKTSLLWNYPNWPVVDPIIIALPLSAITLIVVSKITRKFSEEHVDYCFNLKK